MNIYDLTDQLMQLQEMAESGEYDDELLSDTMEAVEGEFEVKAEGYAKVMRNLEASVNALKAEEKRLAERRKAIENSIGRLKGNLFNAMVQTGKRKFDSGIFKFSIQKNGGALPVVLDVDLDKLPKKYKVITEKPDLKAIAEVLNNGKKIKYAHFGERGESLRIK